MDIKKNPNDTPEVRAFMEEMMRRLNENGKKVRASIRELKQLSKEREIALEQKQDKNENK